MDNEIDYAAVFGVEIPDEGSGATEQEIAEPAAPEEAEGANEQTVAESDVGDDSSDPDEGEGGDGGTKEKQTPEQNARYAAARRKAEAERDEAIKKAREEAQAEAQKVIDEAFRNSGLTNPYTKKPITTKAEYEEYRQQYEKEQRDRVLRKTGMTDEEFNKFVGTLPEVVKAREAAAQAEAVTRQASEEKAKAAMDEQIREIGMLNPAIKSLEDLTAMPNYQQFYALVKRGNTMVDAYKLANFDELKAAKAEAAQQAAYNKAASKSHMVTTGTRGQGAVTVPADVRDMYRIMMPDASDAEIQAHYARSINKK